MVIRWIGDTFLKFCYFFILPDKYIKSIFIFFFFMCQMCFLFKYKKIDSHNYNLNIDNIFFNIFYFSLKLKTHLTFYNLSFIINLI